MARKSASIQHLSQFIDLVLSWGDQILALTAADVYGSSPATQEILQAFQADLPSIQSLQDICQRGMRPEVFLKDSKGKFNALTQ
ncbi:hypothetical protein PTI98_009028 [Pleurotus ostreatus]|uniref:Uncharacterized protein n=1 Tax=Pleurotus ostreatus (strain PC15) TaxID=1137138 RepID=A0A067NWI2_PLEO1|nr:hypothetical protein PTI98_009028 [Pleurotus ostreatus]KDQ32274.1 hypothetical protein PLEOSDRAFT_1100769 [Pleurotus ostreatus PC15]